ncbi:MAG: phytoene/squalene synthase family protein [Sphingobacteriales bacterium]|nr:MAG: phytoene/squalene synthase family protein [Sphingobacteriales bacterium]
MDLYKQTCQSISKLVTQRYSTSFTLGIRTLAGKFHAPIYAIYGFVRFADEIVDTFHDYDREKLFYKFCADTSEALEDGISLNPVLHSFQGVVKEHNISREYIDAFLKSMEMDLQNRQYEPETYNEYIYGSAEVVGLMCLQVFCEGDELLFNSLKKAARSLGAAFQKVNFLRDMKSDYQERGRVYFPTVDFNCFTCDCKKKIETDIEKDFDDAFEGILRLPKSSQLGVYLAYVYYKKLFYKIKQLPAASIKQERVRVPDNEKMALLVSSYVRCQFNVL